MLLVKSVVTFILATILPDVVSDTVHYSVLEQALEVATISPLETAVATHLVVGPRADVLGPISPKVNSFAFLHSIPEVSMVVAAIAPYFNSLAILLILSGDFRLRLDGIEVILDVETNVLTEDAKVGLSVLLPESFINFVRLRGTEHSKTTSLSIDPVAFEGASIRPDHLSVATLGVLVVYYRVVALLSPDSSLAAGSCGHFRATINWHHAHLPHVLQGAKLHGLERELCIFEAQALVLLS